jgi:ABC-type transport system involved in cytochrome c biogenesis permease component
MSAGAIFVIAATELRVEWRSRRVSTTALLLATLVVLVFGFTGARSGVAPAVTAFWVALALAAAAGTAQWAERSHGSGVAAAWHALGVSTASVYAGQTLALAATFAAVALPLGVVTLALHAALDVPGLAWALLDLALGVLALAALSAALLGGLSGLGGRGGRDGGEGVGGLGGLGARLGALVFLPPSAPLLVAAGRASREDLLRGRPGAATGFLALTSLCLVAAGLTLALVAGRAGSRRRCHGQRRGPEAGA